ncbi:hypothetical protein [Streptomyces olivaceoviridis]
MMRRRVATLFAGLAIAAALSLSLPTHAMAATGTLTINRDSYTNPRGCYAPKYGASAWFIDNKTDRTVWTYGGTHCEPETFIGGVEAGQALHKNPSGIWGIYVS